MIFSGKEYKGAVAREIKAALENKIVNKHECFYITRSGTSIIFDSAPRKSYLFTGYLAKNAIVRAAKINGEWVEVNGLDELEGMN